MRHCFRYPSFELERALELFLDRGVPIAARNHQGQTFLHVACSSAVHNSGSWNSVESGENLLSLFPKSEIKALVQVADNQGRYPIHCAATSMEFLVACLIQNGADILVQTYKGKSPLHKAAASRQSDAVGAPLEAYFKADVVDEIDQKDYSGRTPLYYACRSGRLESVRLLLEAGANVQMADGRGCTPLHACAEFNISIPLKARNSKKFKSEADVDMEGLHASDIIRLLCQYGADATTRNKKEKTPLQLALDSRVDEMVTTLLGLKDRSEPEQPGVEDDELGSYAEYVVRHRPAAYVVDEMVEKRLLEQNLFETCKRLLKTRSYDVLEEIADRGFKLNEKNGWTSRFLSSLNRQEFVHLVSKLPGKREDTDRGDGSVPVPQEQEHNLQSFTLRVACGKIRNGSLDSWEAIHIVASGTHWWHAGAIRYLAQQGSSLNEMDEWRGTPLHVAVKGGYRRFETAKALLELGADPNLVHKDRTAPLARAIGDGEMTRLLLQFGADFGAGNPSVAEIKI